MIYSLCARAVRERFKLLEIKFKKKDRQERAASGISPEMTELDVLLEEIVLRIKEFELEFAKTNAEKKEQKDEEIRTAEEMRNKAMETLAETKKGSLVRNVPLQRKNQDHQGAIRYNF